MGPARATATEVLQALLEGPAVRELLYRSHCQVQAAAGVRVLTARVALLLFLLMAPMSARAQTALEVESWCRDFATIEIRVDGKINVPMTAERCWGAFTATQQLSVLGDDTGRPMLKVCPPPAATRVQLVKVFLSYSGRHPELAHLSFGLVVWRAMDEAFPCRSN
jgi:hypothetical protein